MKFWTLFVLFFAFSNFTIAHAEEGSPEMHIAQVIPPNDIRVCAPLRQNDFDEFKRTIEEDFGRTMEDAYDEIRCGGTDVMGIIITEPNVRKNIESRMRRYFERNNPTFFTKILLKKELGKDALKRIEIELAFVINEPNLAGGPIEKRLRLLQRKYRDYLKKYPLE